MRDDPPSSPFADVAPPAAPAIIKDGPDSTPGQRRALGFVATLAVLGILRVAMPVGIGILLGTLAAFILQPLYRRILRRTKRPEVAAMSCVAVATVGVVAMLGAMGYLLVGRGVYIGQTVL